MHLHAPTCTVARMKATVVFSNRTPRATAGKGVVRNLSAIERAAQLYAVSQNLSRRPKQVYWHDGPGHGLWHGRMLGPTAYCLPLSTSQSAVTG